MLIFDLLCFLSLLYFSYQDIKTRYINDKIALALILIGILYNLLTNPYNLIISIILAIFGFFTYYTGMLGGGDTEVLLIISLFMPYYVNILGINIPFVFLVLILAVFLSSIIFPVYYLIKIGKYIETITTIILSIILSYFNIMIGFSFLIFGLFILYYLHKQEIHQKFFVKEKDVDKIDFEEILALEFDPNLKNYTNKRVHLPHEIEKLKEKLKNDGIKKVLVYENLPPFVPFLFVSTLILYFLLKYIKL